MCCVVEYGCVLFECVDLVKLYGIELVGVLFVLGVECCVYLCCVVCYFVLFLFDVDLCGIGVIFMWWFFVWFLLFVFELIGCLELNVVVNIDDVGMLVLISVCVIVNVCLVDSF